MTTFVEPPFWAVRSGRTPAHAVSVRVEPAVTIVSASAANPTVITTLTPHYYVSGDTVLLAGVAGSTPAVDGSRVVTVTGTNTFTVPVTATVAGTGGTATRTLPVEPLTVVQGKLRAGLDWTPGDARDELMTNFIAAARAKLEQDTGLAVLSQVRDVYFDAIGGDILSLPWLSTPLRAVVSISSEDTSGATNVLATTQYVVDTASGRIGLALGGSWPTDTRPFQPIVVRIVSGAATIAEIPAWMTFAIGLLTAHWATLGRDAASIETATEVPFGYSNVIQPYSLVSVA